MAKYRAFPPVHLPDRTWPDRQIVAAPQWCSVDLRDGNQALAVPMGIEAKIEMFHHLVNIGFKQIEVGFPSASQIEFDFIRRLIDEGRIPDDVQIQVLTQAREHLIRRTIESVNGSKNVILHIYNSTSPLQRRITFNMSKDEILAIAVDGTRLLRELSRSLVGTRVTLEYSPESFSDTELDYSLAVCEAVAAAWAPAPDEKIIFNLPATVEWSTANIHADQIEWFCRNISNRHNRIISLHTHNDRGTGVAATELGLMAGGDRVEGTLFGNGERTGNLDLVTVALNMFSQGIDPRLKFANLPEIRLAYERLTGMKVHERHPYAGDLVFTAFSGSHQDAIKKGMDRRVDGEHQAWEVPYLTIDPKDVGRSYEAIIRINSQSGKGGVAYVLSREYGIELPKTLQPELGQIVNNHADQLGRELSAPEIYELFRRNYVECEAPLKILRMEFLSTDLTTHSVSCRATVEYAGTSRNFEGSGNGPISAFVHGMGRAGWGEFTLTDFKEQAVGSGEEAEAMAFVQIRGNDGRLVWGVGMDTDISLAGLRAVAGAYNRMVGRGA